MSFNDNNVQYEMNKTCRACLNNKDILEPIYNSYLKDLFISLTNLEIRENDGFPSNMCLICVERLNICSSFRELCIKSDILLKQTKLIKTGMNDALQGNALVSNVNDVAISHFLELSFLERSEAALPAELSNTNLNSKQFPSNDKFLVLNTSQVRNESKDIQDVNKLKEAEQKSYRKKLPLSKKSKRRMKAEAREKSSESKRTLRNFEKKYISEIPKNKKSSKKYQPKVEEASFKLENEESSKQNYNLNLSCPECGQFFKKANRLEAHFRVHSGMKPEVCKECNGEFASWQSLKLHMLRHTGVKNHVCLECGKCFAYLTVLRMHEKVHKGIRSYVCDVCGKSFLTNNNLKLHIANKHSDERPYACKDCPQTFKNSSTLKRHILRHSGIKNFICTICGHGSTTKGELNMHMKTHSQEKPFACSSCSKCYKTSKELVVHNRTHTGERPHKCDLCPMTFTISKILKNHRMTHTGEKPHICSVCRKAFTQKVTLKTHMKTHNNIINTL